MQQRFDTRKYSIRDFEEWSDRGELTLSAKFQRRTVWNDKARSFLIDTIIRGKPIPKIYMRQDTDPKTRRTVREIVDGQQRLHTVLSFLRDAFKISRVHNEEFGGEVFSELPDDIQRGILKYEFAVDLLQDMPDPEVHDVFARLNTYSVRLNPQELRNAEFFGEFKTSAYSLASEFFKFWEMHKIFTDQQILRMAEVEFVSELLIAISVGIRAKEKKLINKFYKDWDNLFPGRKTHERQFRDTMDTIGAMMSSALSTSPLRASRLFYPLFCAVFHYKFKLPAFNAVRKSIRAADFPKIRLRLEEIDVVLTKAKAAEEGDDTIRLSPEERKFYDAYSEHWVHADKRKTLTSYLCKLLARSI
jgi:hypothetical protein